VTEGDHFHLLKVEQNKGNQFIVNRVPYATFVACFFTFSTVAYHTDN